VRQAAHWLARVSVAWLACGCAHAPWVGDPSSEPPKVCAAIQPRSSRGWGPGPDAPVARAQSFYCRSLYVPAATLLTEEVIDKPDAPAADRATALRWLVYIHRRFPGWDWIATVVGQAGGVDLDQPELADLRDELHLLAGQDANRRAQFAEAFALLRAIPASSPLHVRATLFEGAIHVQTGAPERAQLAFAEALRSAAADRDPKHARDRELAVISLARSHYALGQFETASRYYESLPASSEYGISAAVEGAWTRVQMKDQPRALGLLQSVQLRSRDVPADTMAEAMLLEAAIAVERNQYRDAQIIIVQFNEVFPALFVQAGRLAGYDLNALYDIGFSVRTGGSLAPPLGAERTLRLLADGSVARHFDELDEIAREEKAIAATSAYPDIEAGIDLRERRDVAEREAGDSFRRRLQLVADHLAERVEQAGRIDWDARQLEQIALRRLY